MNPDSPLPEAALPLSEPERLARNKTQLLDALKRAGAVRATVSYHGGGDEGCADGAGAFSGDGASVDLAGTVLVFRERYDHANGQWTTSIDQQEEPLDAALCDYAMEAVARHHGGWENNEGGYGEVVFDCEAGTVRLEHNDYIIETDYTETAL